eukprot:192994_1
MGTFPSTVQKPLHGREFPNRLKAPNHSLPDWLEFKKKNDQKRLGFDSKYWCIGNKCYDFTPWYNSHPGGKSWLEITKGMDCTAVYECHHPSMDHNPIFKQSLQKYFVCNVNNIQKDDDYYYNTFTFDPNISRYIGLRDTIYKALIKQHKNGRKWNLPSIKMHISCLIVLVIFLITFIYLCIHPSFWVAVLTGICMNPLIGIAHNFMHQGDNKGVFGIETYWKYCIYLTLHTLENWNIHHVLSHHQDINLDSDIEVTAFEGIINFMTNQPTNHILIYLYAPCFYMFSLPLLHIPILIDLYKRGRLKIKYLIPILELLIMIVMNYNGILTIFISFWYWVIMHGTMYTMLMIVSTPIHRSDMCWTEGDTNGTKDFLEHTLLTTMDYYVNWGFFASLFMFDTFNDHRLHHLFPTLDASKISQLKPVFEKYCKQNGLKKYFKETYGLGQLLMGLLRYWYRRSPIQQS